MTTQAVIAIPAENGWRGKWISYDGYPSAVAFTVRHMVRKFGLDATIDHLVLQAPVGHWEMIAMHYDGQVRLRPTIGVRDAWVTEPGSAEYVYVITRTGLLIHRLSGVEYGLPPQHLPWWEPLVGDHGQRYEPWTDGLCAGMKVTSADGTIEHVTLNPTSNETCVFVYEGPFGDPTRDVAVVHLDLNDVWPEHWEDLPSSRLEARLDQLADDDERRGPIEAVLLARELAGSEFRAGHGQVES